MNNPDFQDLFAFQKLLLSFTKEDQLKILVRIERMNPSNYIYLSSLIVNTAIARPKLVPQYSEFICTSFLEYNSLLTTFANHLFDLASTQDRDGINTINYLLNQLLEHSIIKQQDIIDKLQTNIYFSHILMNNKLVLSTTRSQPANNFLQNIEEYSENDWKKHRELMNKGMNPNPITEVIFNDDVDTLQHLVSGNGMNPNTQIQPSIYDLLSFNKPVTLVEYSALCNSLNCFKFLILNGGRITKDIDYYAISGGNTEIIHICEQKGIKHNTNTSIFLALKYHHMHLFKWLLENEPTIDVYQNIMFFSDYEAIDFINESEYQFHHDSLIKAIEHNQFVIFKAIIERGVTEFFTERESAIHKSCTSKHTIFFKYLFENKENFHLDFNHPLQNGMTPLHSACQSGIMYYIESLVQLPGIQINAQTNEGIAPLHIAVSGNHLEVVKFLIEHNADPNLCTYKRNNCFHFACHSNNVDMLNYIISVCNNTVNIDQMNSQKVFYF